MGLMISILVSCVGVVELLAFYSHLRRDLTVSAPEDGDLSTITGHYKGMLAKKYKLTLQRDVGNVTTNFSLSTSPNGVFVALNDQRTRGMLDDLQCNGIEKKTKESKTVLEDDSGSLVSGVKTKSIEMEVKYSDGSVLREFDLNMKCEEEKQTNSINEEIAFENLSERIEKEINDGMFTSSSKFQREEHHQQSMVETQQQKHQTINVQIHDYNQNIETQTFSEESPSQRHESNDVTYQMDQQHNPHSSSSISPNATTSVEKLYRGEETTIDPVYGGRCGSPFPTYEKLAPRGSVCELAENPTIKITEAEEFEERDAEREHCKSTYWRRSRTRSKSPYKERLKRSKKVEGHRSVMYFSSPKTLNSLRNGRHRSVSPKPKIECYLGKRRRSKSFSNHDEEETFTNYQIVDRYYWRRSSSPFQDVGDETKKFLIVFGESLKNSLDGVKAKEDKKAEFRRKREARYRGEEVTRMLCYGENLDEHGSSSEMFSSATLSSREVLCGRLEGKDSYDSNNVEKIINKKEGDDVCSVFNSELKKNKEDIVESRPSTSKEKGPEPFWVK